MAKKSTSKAAKLAFQRYRDEDRKRKNKVRKLTNYCLKNPNDAQAATALDRL